MNALDQAPHISTRYCSSEQPPLLSPGQNRLCPSIFTQMRGLSTFSLQGADVWVIEVLYFVRVAGVERRVAWRA